MEIQCEEKLPEHHGRWNDWNVYVSHKIYLPSDGRWLGPLMEPSMDEISAIVMETLFLYYVRKQWEGTTYGLGSECSLDSKSTNTQDMDSSASRIIWNKFLCFYTTCQMIVLVSRMD